VGKEAQERTEVANNGRELFEHELRDIYDAESKLVNALESMANKVSDEKLAASFREHRDVTKKQAQRLERVFEIVGRAPRREPCEGINGLISEFQKFVKEEDPSEDVLNVFATGAAQKVEHYEIVSYKSLIELAGHCGLPDAVQLLEQSLAEEEETAQELETMSQQLGEKLAFNN
jgi:ferritin-like metal-binding protein YciE